MSKGSVVRAEDANDPSAPVDLGRFAQLRAIDWVFVNRWAGTIGLVVVFALAATRLSALFLTPPYANVFVDAHIYYQATAAWLAGGNPWAVSWNGIPFAAPPPVLLLNVPLIPFGESFAVSFWVAANAASVLYLFRRFRLAPYWFLFFPILEGFLAATPDLTLAAVIALGGGAISALTKPYAIPAMLAVGRWVAVIIALVVGVLSIPLLPWGQFWSSRGAVASAFDDFTLVVSAYGEPLLMLATAVALLSLGLRLGFGLLTPGLIAQQPHYLIFSLEFIAASRLLSFFMTLPTEHAAAFGIIVFAIVDRVRRAGVFETIWARIAVKPAIG